MNGVAVTMSIRRKDLKEGKRIAMGGMAELTLASDPEGRQVVIRQLHRRLVFNVRVHRGFLRGIRLRRSLCPHPNLACPISHGYSGLVPYEIIEYVPGENLRELIMHRHESVRTHALEILRQVAEALAYMHTQHVLHLDVKPENTLVDNTDMAAGLKVKLTDFDLSRHCSHGKIRSRSGTVSHMAPEQLRGGCISYANDIFAFGVMAYYLVTGKMPFSGFSLEQMRKQQASRRTEVAEPRRFNADLAPKLNWIIVRCLEKDRAKRFPSMSYLTQELGRI
ncbi:MAG: serine/threonine protein kinase [Candidatus Pacebacteria bacterium]|nr:serine/threonine protein kinase [Candidatus Paceibacterota bacterium]